MTQLIGRRNNVAVTRDTLNRISMLLCTTIIDDETQPGQVRDEAAELQFILSEVLAYGFGPKDSDNIRLVPAGFRFPNFYSDMVDELVLDLYGGEPEGVESISVMMARQAAAHADNALFSTDMRLENADCLAEIIASMRQRAADDDADQDAEIDCETEEHIVRSTNGTH
jgi:hypothetical protein